MATRSHGPSDLPAVPASRKASVLPGRRVTAAGSQSLSSRGDGPWTSYARSTRALLAVTSPAERKSAAEQMRSGSGVRCGAAQHLRLSGSQLGASLGAVTSRAASRQRRERERSLQRKQQCTCAGANSSDAYRSPGSANGSSRALARRAPVRGQKPGTMRA
ncbi:hypothetical protein FA09DRAFT_329898 [Tilletiopsis washingtonensis]|uniref:Uncharacterized protein n=1 Tax=Tilletiopsis washingtonensis TaxID=58919 RepID=A0A316ZB98_9BASI|nr:hypothetical protein FA09DRAFT_329898 [Tilletiopsis washingtonensis]PWN98298.1 hypothetical protein FA09DRAFT_329898 [Tilletiopsis washingtonensis]